MASPEPTPDSLDETLAGRCPHGFGAATNCGTCTLTLAFVGSIRRLFADIFDGFGAKR